MTTRGSLEERVYRAEFESGLLEVFVGAGLMLMGLGWLADQVVLAAVIPMTLVILWRRVNARFVVPRTGAVRFRSDRQRKVRRGMLTLAAVGAAALILGVVLWFWQTADASDLVTGSVVAGLPAFLLGVGSVLAGAAFDLRRLFGHAIALAVASVVVVVWHLHPGWAMLGPGALLLFVGAPIFTGFIRANPRVEVEV